MLSSNAPPAAWCGYGGSWARAPTPWQIGCDGWPASPADVVHRLCRDLVRDAETGDLLLGLEHPRTREQAGRVGCIRERVEPGLGEGRRLADHAVGRLRPERELEADAVVRACHRD